MSVHADSPRALFVSSVLGHKKFEDRYDSLVAAGFCCSVIAADWSCGREDSEKRGGPTIRTVKRPGVTSGAGRTVLWARFLRELLRLKMRGERFALVVANTVEMALLAEQVFDHADRKILDLADVHPRQYSPGITGKVLRKLELGLGANRWEYVVSSPWFYWDYLLAMVGSKAPAYLVENTVLPQRRVAANIVGPKPDRVRVLWNGVLRCNSSALVLSKLAARFPGEVQITLAGTLDLLSNALVESLLRLKNVQYFGRYDDRQLAAIFDDVDVVWVADFDDGLNSRLLLPNRLYQSIRFRKPVLGVGNSATSSYVMYFGLGAVCANTEPDALMSGLRVAAGTPMAHCREPHTTFVDVLNAHVPCLPKVEDLSVLARASHNATGLG